MNKVNRVVIVSILLLFSLNSFIDAQQAYDQIVLVKGQSRILNAPDLHRVAVGDEAIVDVLALENDLVLLNPKSLGITSLHLWSEDEQEIYQLRVVADDGTLTQELLAVVDIPSIDARFIDEFLILEGQVSNKAEKERAEKIAVAYSDAIISLLHYPTETIAEQLVQEISRLADQSLAISVVNDTIILEGEVETTSQYESIYRLASAFDYPVVDLIRVKQQPVIEVDEKPQIKLTDQIAKAIGLNIKVEKIGEIIFLEGFVENDYQHRRAIAIAEAFGVDVIDLLQIEESTEDIHVEPIELPDNEATDEEIINDLHKLIANPQIKLTLLYDHLIVEGEVEDYWDKQRAIELSSIAGLPVIDLVSITVDIPETMDQTIEDPSPELPELIANPNIDVKWINKTVILEGVVLRQWDKQRALNIAGAFSDNVIDLIKVHQPIEIPVPPPPQIENAEEDNCSQSQAELHQNLIDEVITALKEPGVIVDFYNETLVLEGIVPNESAKSRAEKIAALYYQPTVCFLEIPQPGTVNTAAQLANHLGLSEVQATLVGTNIVLEGVVQDQREHHRVLEIAQLYGSIVDLLTVKCPEQVLLQVHVVELDRNTGEKLGIKWGELVDGYIFKPDLIQFEEITHIGSWNMKRSSPLAAQLQFLETEGKAKILAAPSLLTLSGETASFLAGGEIPLVIEIGGGQTVEWHEYGVKLEIDPLILEEDKVRVKLNPEVSSLDWSNAAQFNNSTLPALQTRRTSTTVTVNHGETVVIGGLIHYEDSVHIEKVPILGDLPILGALFRSKQYQQNQTELVIFVTPWIVSDKGDFADEY